MCRQFLGLLDLWAWDEEPLLVQALFSQCSLVPRVIRALDGYRQLQILAVFTAWLQQPKKPRSKEIDFSFTFFCYSQGIHCSLPYLPTQVSQSHTSKIHNVYFDIPQILSHSMILIMEEEADQEKRNWEKNLEAAINHLTAFNNFPSFWDLSFSLHNFCHYFYFFLVSISQLLLLHFNPSLKRIFFSAFLLKMDAINKVLTRGAGITVMNTSVYHTTNFFQNPNNNVLKAQVASKQLNSLIAFDCCLS